MIDRSRQLRRVSSFPERLLWSRLRDERLAGLKFRRQHSVGPYVADFFCAEAAVVVELDGRSHEERGAYDQKRSAYLEAQGLRVIRFSNDRLLRDLEGVLIAISKACLPEGQ